MQNKFLPFLTWYWVYAAASLPPERSVRSSSGGGGDSVSLVLVLVIHVGDINSP